MGSLMGSWMMLERSSRRWRNLVTKGSQSLISLVMTDETRKTVEEIDALIRKNAWFDFHVSSYNGSDLVITGSTDFSYYHELEITFHNVFFATCYFKYWKSDTTSPVFFIPEQEEAYQMNFQLEIEVGFDLFIFKVEDSKTNVTIAAKSVSYNTDTVLYYYRENLPPGMRLAAAYIKPKE
ncbi:hypothetical protein I2I05_12785 [Hymenobacter sp. BT683]|uniref:Uncharacterized protein n=1 Tax=Hymenobacter jeongseonensis TaxID=2791027 RepID=A0ABS0IIU8_9BACT|nr:hypothetical protein [Hymenobacter jeongseonensis]MBF9238273.1 hypothetical protein [Hymenobacter jeongseonensis]